MAALRAALLTASFALWGIGDIFRNWGVDTSVAKVGSVEITADQVGNAGSLSLPVIAAAVVLGMVRARSKRHQLPQV